MTVTTKNHLSLHGPLARSRAKRAQAKRSHGSGDHRRDSQCSPLAILALTLGGAVLMIAVALVPSVADAAQPSPGTSVGSGMNVQIADTPHSSDSGSSDGARCDDTRDGWHIIMNGLSASDGQPATAEDFGPVNLAFSDGTTAQAWFTDFSGRTAHFLNDTINQQGSFTVTGGAMTLPIDTRITSFNKFAIRHTPCGTSVTATTANPVSTETTTSTSPVSAEISSTAPQTADSDPVVTPPTTTLRPGMPDGTGAAPAAVEREVQVARIAPANSGSNLGSPGLDGRPFVAMGMLLVIAGGALWVYTQRKTAA